MASSVDLEHIRVTYDGQDVVHDVNFSVGDGELVVLVGPSGSGKTSVLRAITGYAPITGGRVLIDGIDRTYSPPGDRDIAMVFQNLALYPHLTVRENWEFPLRAAKMPQEERLSRVRAIAEMLQMSHLLHRYPQQLSGGQKQRVAMGRALVRQPQLFLLDEPLGALDAKLRVEARSAFKALQRELGITTIYVTHDQVEAQALGTRIVVLNDGVVQQIGTPDEIYDSPTNRFVAGLFGQPPMNFLEGELEVEGGSAALRRGAVLYRLPSETPDLLARTNGSASVTIGIRPGTIRILPGPETHSIAASVYVTEPAGHNVLVDAQVGDDRIWIRGERGDDRLHRLRPDDPIHLGIDPAQIFVFDSQTGHRII
jgi:multiple sugar transport system ATP-binding protein